MQLVFDILKLRYKTDLPNASRAHMSEFVINKGNISIAILTEDVDDSIMTRLQMVNPLTGETGLDRVFDETFAARVALQGPLADVVPHYDLAVMQDIVTASSRLHVWRCRGEYAVSALDPGCKRMTFPVGLRGLRWVVEDGVAKLHVGQPEG